MNKEPKKIKIGFLGYGTRALDALMEHPLFEVTHFFAPEARLNKDVMMAKEKYKDTLQMISIKDNDELLQHFEQIKDTKYFLMNACSIILNRKVIEKMEVFNIHPGDLLTNRGHHPHLWTIYYAEPFTKITLHKVSELIDDGMVIKSVEIPVTDQDDAWTILNKAEDQVPALLDGLYEFLTGGAEPQEYISQGNYRRKMTFEDYEIHPVEDSVEWIRRKIAARASHSGAFVLDGKIRYYVDRIKEVIPGKNESPKVIISRTNREIHLLQKEQTIILHLSKMELVKEKSEKNSERNNEQNSEKK